MIFLIAFATLLSTLLGGLFAIRFKDKLHLILGFSAGAVLGVALFDLIPESINLASKTYDTSKVALFIALGFVIYLILDRLFSLHAHDEHDCDKSSHKGPLAAATLAFHSMLDGLAIGLAFKVSSVVGGIVAIAVLTHDFSDGINTVGMILRGHGNKSQAIRWLILDAIAPVIGIIISQIINISQASLGLTLAVFAGLFLYIGASDLIPESHHRHPTIWTTISTILGISVIYLAVTFAG